MWRNLFYTVEGVVTWDGILIEVRETGLADDRASVTCGLTKQRGVEHAPFSSCAFGLMTDRPWSVGVTSHSAAPSKRAPEIHRPPAPLGVFRRPTQEV